MQKSRKIKGFTLTELAIVIAVIAILIAVLVPTFTSIINKANESSDSQLVKNLNTALSVDEATNGKAATISDALAIAEDNGYTVSKISPTSAGYDIVWDETSNRFVLMNGDEVVYYDSSATVTDSMTLWYITNSTSLITDDGKNYYYANAIATTDGSVTVTGNVDLSASEVTTINVDATNGDATVVADGADVVVTNNTGTDANTVNIYGSVATISAAENSTFGMNSLHIYGTVTGKIELSAGRVVAEAGSYIKSIIITVDSTENLSETIAIEADSSSTVQAVAATTEAVAAKISIISSGVSSSSIVTTEVSSAFGGGTGTESNPYQIAKLEHFEGLREMIDDEEDEYATAGVYFELTSDIDLGDDWEPLGAVFYYTSSGSATVYGDYSNIFYGIFDGGNYTITMNDTTAFGGINAYYADYALFSYVGTGAVIKNINFYMDVEDYETTTCGAVASYVLGDGADSILFENITVDGTINAIAYGGGVVGWAAQGCTFKNCVNKANITTNRDKTNSSYSYSCIGGISAQASSIAYNCTYVSNGSTMTLNGDHSVSFINCENYGTLKHATTNTDSYSIIGNITAKAANEASSGLTALDENGVKYSTLTFTNCTCAGTIYGVKKSSDTSYQFEGYVYGSNTETVGSYDKTYDATSQTANPYKLLIGGRIPNTIIDGVTVITSTINTNESSISISTTLNYFYNGVAISTDE